MPAKPFPKQFGDTTVLMATFAYDYLDTERRCLCVFFSRPNSKSPRWIAYWAETDRQAKDHLINQARLDSADADFVVNAAHQAQQEFQRTAGQFIPAVASAH